MSRIRIYQLAKELEMPSKELINKLNEFGIQVTNHMSTLEKEEVDIIKELYDIEQSEEIPRKTNVKPKKNVKEKSQI